MSRYYVLIMQKLINQIGIKFILCKYYKYIDILKFIIPKVGTFIKIIIISNIKFKVYITF